MLRPPSPPRSSPGGKRTLALLGEDYATDSDEDHAETPATMSSQPKSGNGRKRLRFAAPEIMVTTILFDSTKPIDPDAIVPDEDDEVEVEQDPFRGGGNNDGEEDAEEDEVEVEGTARSLDVLALKQGTVVEGSKESTSPAFSGNKQQQTSVSKPFSFAKAVTVVTKRAPLSSVPETTSKGGQISAMWSDLGSESKVVLPLPFLTSILLFCVC
jgi:hypothetical protein